MDDASREQLDARNKINDDFLERNGSGDYTALDEYLSKYDNAPDYSEGRIMDDASREQLDARNKINDDFLERNGSGDYTALDEYLSKYDSPDGNTAGNETPERAVENDGNERTGENQTENNEPAADENDDPEKKSTLKETLAAHANPEADTETEEKIKETEEKLEEAEVKLEASTEKVENSQDPEERKEAVNEQEKNQTAVNNFADLLNRYRGR